MQHRFQNSFPHLCLALRFLIVGARRFVGKKALQPLVPVDKHAENDFPPVSINGL
jgi:hypothetical protein